MKTLTALDIAANGKIPEGFHPLLRVDNRKAWVKVVSKLVTDGAIKATPKNIKKLLECWETLLISHYSNLN
jgi:hypothetical protein